MWKVLSTEKEDSGGPSYIGTLLKKKRSVKEILAEIVRDTARISSCFSDFVYVVSRTISYSVSESSLHFISCLQCMQEEPSVTFTALLQFLQPHVKGWPGAYSIEWSDLSLLGTLLPNGSFKWVQLKQSANNDLAQHEKGHIFFL